MKAALIVLKRPQIIKVALRSNLSYQRSPDIQKELIESAFVHASLRYQQSRNPEN